MADAPKLIGSDTLRTAYPKLNTAIDNANAAITKSEEAGSKADLVKSQLEEAKPVFETGEYEGITELGFGTNLSSTVSNTSVSFILGKALVSKGKIGSVKLNTVGGNVKISILRKLSTNSFIVLSTHDVSTTSGTNSYDTDIEVPEQGLYMGISGPIKFAYETSSFSYNFWDVSHVLVVGETLSGLVQSSAGKITFGILVDFSYKTELRKLSENSPVTISRLTGDALDTIIPSWTESEVNYINYVFDNTITNGSATKTFIINKALEYKGVIKKLKINAYGEYVAFKLFRKTSTNTFEVVLSTDLVTKIGEYEYEVNITVPETGLYVGYYGSVRYAKSTNQPSTFYDIPGTTNVVSGSVSGSLSTLTGINFGIKADGVSLFISEAGEQIYSEFNTVRSEILDQKQSINSLSESVTSIIEGVAIDLKSSLVPVYSEGFLVNNPQWYYQNCTPSAEGLHVTGSAKAYFNKYLTFDTFYDKVNVKVIDVNSVFGIVHQHTIKGAVYIVDGTNKVLNLYYQYTGDTLPGIRASTPLTFDLVSGTEYILEVFKTGWKHTFTITDPKSLSKTTVSFDNSSVATSGSYAGKGWGSPGVIQRSGEVIFKRHNYSVAHFPEAKVLFIGDSITEGTNMGAGVSIDLRWCSQLRAKLYKGDAIICGRGGSTSDDVLLRMDDLYSIGVKSKIVVVLIGTNERSDAALVTWKSNIVTIYNKIIAQGAVPVICVPPIPNQGISYITQMRDFIIEKGWNTVRFDYATSLNRDGVTYDATVYSDGVHPNEKGSNLMYQQALIDLGSM